MTKDQATTILMRLNMRIDELMNMPVPQGIYFSKVTGKIFEVTVKRDRSVIRYVDGDKGLTQSKGTFNIQLNWLEYYELLMPYEV